MEQAWTIFANTNHLFLKKKNLFIYLFLAMLGLHCCSGFSLVVMSGGLLSSCGVQAYRGGFFCCRAQALGHLGFTS